MTRLEKVRNIIDSAPCDKRTKSQVLSVFRKSREAQEMAQDSLVESLGAMPLGKAIRLGLVESSRKKPDTVLSEKELKIMLQEILSHLSPEQRKVIEGYYLNELSIEELAKELDLSQKEVENMKRRAMGCMRRCVYEMPELRSLLQ